MNDYILMFPYLLPILILTSTICVMLLMDAFITTTWKKSIYFLSQIMVIVTIWYTCKIHFLPEITLFYESLIFDKITITFQIILLIMFCLNLVYFKDYIDKHKYFYGETLILSFCSLLGMIIVIASGNFFTFYLGIELVSMPLYALCVINKNIKNSEEAGLKYFLMGVISSGFLLYGISLVYGAVGSFNFNIIFNEMSMPINEGFTTLQFGIVFIIAAIAFKLGAVPFHMWLPDVYHGASSVIAMFIATTVKLAAFGMMLRLLINVFAESHKVSFILSFLSVLSLFLGNIVAIIQTNFKRFLAYSAIGHIGFVLLGFVSQTIIGYQASIFYMILYVFMILGLFSIIILTSDGKKEFSEINDYKGFARNHPWLALIMLILLFSMAGIPPTVGFYAKFLVLQSLVESKLWWLVILAIITSVISAFYYLRIVKLMYLDEPKGSDEKVDNVNVVENVDNIKKVNNSQHITKINKLQLGIFSVNGLSMLIFGVFPAPILQICLYAVS